jgi:hypothetical protein
MNIVQELVAKILKELKVLPSSLVLIQFTNRIRMGGT